MSWSKLSGLQRPTLDEEMALLADEEAFVARQRIARWDKLGRCHACGHWRVTPCNVDGFFYCEADYPSGLR